MWWRVTQHKSHIRAKAIAKMNQSRNIVPTHQTNTAVRDSSRHQGEGSTEGEGLMVEVVNESSASSPRLGTMESKGDACDERVTWVNKNTYRHFESRDMLVLPCLKI